MGEELTLDDVFNGSAVIEQEAIQEIEAPVEVAATPPPPPISPPVVEDEIKADAHGNVPLTVVQKMREEKREFLKTHSAEKAALEKRVQDYEAMLKGQNPETPKTETAKEAAKRVALLEDPDGYEKYQDERVAAMESRLAEIQNQAELRSLMIQSELIGRDNPDFPQMIEEFKTAASRNPHLVDQMKAAPNPAFFAYKTGKNFAEAKLYGGDVNKMIAAKVAEERTKWEDDAKKTAENARLASLPKSNVTKRSDKGGASSKKDAADDESPFKKDY